MSLFESGSNYNQGIRQYFLLRTAPAETRDVIEMLQKEMKPDYLCVRLYFYNRRYKGME